MRRAVSINAEFCIGKYLTCSRQLSLVPEDREVSLRTACVCVSSCFSSENKI